VRLPVPLVVALALVSGACTGGYTDSESRTPQITVKSGTELDAALLSTDDLRAVKGLADDVHAVALNELDVFQDPDPRAPCGKKIAALDLSNAAGIGVASTTLQGAQLVVRLDEQAATDRLDALRGDAREGCAAYETTTNRGTTQTVMLDGVPRLPPLADQSIATTSTIEGGETTVHKSLVVIRKAGVIAVLVVFGSEPLGDGTVVALATRMAARLT
jgi:hypothetical protein